MQTSTAPTARHVVRPPGLHRLGVRPAVWVDDAGDEVRDAVTLARLDGLRIPPAWTHVWAAPTGDAPLQATGVDARGRTQYLYSPEAVARAEERKFSALMDFAAALPVLRERVDADLAALESASPAVPLTAAAVRLLDQGLFRVGTDRYARDNHTFGLTTLTRAHVSVDGDALAFDFVGKEHISHHIVVEDPAVAGVIRARLAVEDGDDSALFSTAERPVPRRIDSVTVNSYIHAHSGTASSAKTFRTWGATVAAAAVAGGARFDAERRVRDDLAPYHAAAQLLGDTLAVARRSYVHPSATLVGGSETVRKAVSAASSEAGTDAVQAILRAEVLRRAVYEGLLSTDS
ncbi:hypothetical protein A0130_11410 [Leifsonia xyli]|uniref:DNA topoisomerase IB n=1 Tax=Leifsonia xyli TaxID=1575 RepID=UPI0007CDD919|nr:hypothetical protein A0130_11410 [Leifsonia xyli]